MKVKIITKNETVLLNPENVVIVRKYSSRGSFVEISCLNNDVYRFVCNGTAKETEKFLKDCNQLVDAIAENERKLFVCSFEEYDSIKFEKASYHSYID